MTNPVTLRPSEDEVFDTLWGWVTSLFDPTLAAQIAKADQNATSTLYGTYALIRPGVREALNQTIRTYDAAAGAVSNELHTGYWYQVDCYGPQAPDWANTIAAMWRTMWSTDALRGAALIPLYADQPQQLNIVNGEGQYEQRYMVKLHAQVNQVATAPQPFFTEAPATTATPVDIVPLD